MTEAKIKAILNDPNKREEVVCDALVASGQFKLKGKSAKCRFRFVTRDKEVLMQLSIGDKTLFCALQADEFLSRYGEAEEAKHEA